MIFLIITIFIILPTVIIMGMNWAIQDYSEKDKKEIWENFYKQLENTKDLFK